MTSLATPKVQTQLLNLFEFQRLFSGARSMAIVGSASSVTNWENGAHIDSHDIVVRFNRATTEGLEACVGSRTDIVVANQGNHLGKAPSPQDTVKPKCVVNFCAVDGLSPSREENRQPFLEWVANTPLYFIHNPEIPYCDIPRRKRSFSMGTYTLHALPTLLGIERLFVTGFTLFGQVPGGSDHYCKKSTRASCTWHDADLESYLVTQILRNYPGNLETTEEVAKLLDQDDDLEPSQVASPSSFLSPWYLTEKLGKLLLMAGFRLRRFSEQQRLTK